MAVKATAKKTSFLSIALSPKDKALIRRAARILELPPSIYVRTVALEDAAKIVSVSKDAK